MEPTIHTRAGEAVPAAAGPAIAAVPGGSIAPPRAGFLSDPVGYLAAYARYWFAMTAAVVLTVVFFSVAMLGLLMPRRAARRWMLDAARWWGSSILWVSRCPIDVRFRAPRPEGGFLFFANHQSMLDIVALFVALGDTPFAFAAKRELYRVPLVGWYLSVAGFVEVDRDNRERAAASYRKAAQQLREGAVICVYPEGTRSIDGSVLPFKKGPFVLAIESQVPIVPVAVEGAQHAVRKHTRRLYGATVRVRVGEPIQTRGLALADREALLVRTRKAVLALHREAGAPPSPEEPMIAPAGKPSGERDG